MANIGLVAICGTDCDGRFQSIIWVISAIVFVSIIINLGTIRRIGSKVKGNGVVGAQNANVPSTQVTKQPVPSQTIELQTAAKRANEIKAVATQSLAEHLDGEGITYQYEPSKLTAQQQAQEDLDAMNELCSSLMPEIDDITNDEDSDPKIE